MSKSAEKILDTAEQLFNQHSFVAVGVDLIRDQSGCSKTTLYTYFKNKQQLIAEVLKKRDQDYRQSLLDYVAGHDQVEALQRIMDWHMQWFQSDRFKGCLFVRAVAESSGQDQEVIQLARAHKLWLRDYIKQQCQGIEQHGQGLAHADEISSLFALLIEGLISRFLVEGYDPDVAAATKASLLRLITPLK